MSTQSNLSGPFDCGMALTTPVPAAMYQASTTTTASTTASGGRFVGVKTVDLFVGPNRVPVTLHKDRLLQVSPFFKAAFTSNFQEGLKQTMNLPDEDVGTIEVFAQWLYTQHYAITSTFAPDEKRSKRLDQPISLYIFAEKYQMLSLKQLLLRELYDSLDQWGSPTLNQVERIYESTIESSALRKLFMHWFIWKLDATTFWQEARAKEWLQANTDIAADIAVAFSRRAFGIDENLFEFGSGGVNAFLYETSFDIPDEDAVTERGCASPTSQNSSSNPAEGTHRSSIRNLCHRLKRY